MVLKGKCYLHRMNVRVPADCPCTQYVATDDPQSVDEISSATRVPKHKTDSYQLQKVETVPVILTYTFKVLLTVHRDISV